MDDFGKSIVFKNMAAKTNENKVNIHQPQITTKIDKQNDVLTFCAVKRV